MKILINRKVVEGPWGGGNLFVSAFCDVMSKRGHEVVHSLDHDLDAIFLQDPRYSDLGISINEVIAYKKAKPGVKVFHRVNECDARKGTNEMDDLLRACSSYTDFTFFVSHWMKNYHLEKGWNCHSTDVVYNGVNQNHFYPCSDKEKINNGKINIVAHHWSNNRMKGFDIYEAIDRFVSVDDRYTFTYIGRDLGTFKNTEVIKPLSGRKLGSKLSTYDVYVSGTIADPGPNHILEALSCRLPTYVLDSGGGSVEFAGIDHSFSSFKCFISKITKEISKNSFIPGDWQNCIESYADIIEDLA